MASATPPAAPPQPTGDLEQDYRALRTWIMRHWTWYNHSSQSQALKEAVKAEFGIQAPTWNPEDVRVDAKLVARLRGIVPRMYEETQKALRKERLGARLHLLRGVVLALQDDEFEYYATALESWTTDRKWASRFAQEPLGDILEADMPAERIFMWHGGPGWQPGTGGDQAEYMVLSESPR